LRIRPRYRKVILLEFPLSGQFLNLLDFFVRGASSELESFIPSVLEVLLLILIDSLRCTEISEQGNIGYIDLDVLLIQNRPISMVSIFQAIFFVLIWLKQVFEEPHIATKQFNLLDMLKKAHLVQIIPQNNFCLLELS